MDPKLSVEPRPVSQDDKSPLRLVIVGPPGVGKTTLGLTFPRPLIINTDFGLEGDALKSLKDVGGKEISPAGYGDLEAIYFWIRDRADQFDTVFIDSLDETVRLTLDEIVDEGKGKRDTKGSSGVGKSVLDYVPEQAEYLANSRRLHTFLSALRLLNKHIVVTSAVGEAKGGQPATVDVSPQLKRIVHRWASVMGALVVVEDDRLGEGSHRVLLTDPANRSYLCKTRYSALLPYVVEPSYDKLWTAIEAGRNPSTAEEKG